MERIFLASCLIFLFAIAPIALTAVRVSAASPPPVYYVASTGSDSTGNGSINSPFATISNTVAHATSGSTIIVEPGTYAETVMITKQVTLKSQSSQPSNTVIDAIGMPVGVVVLGSGAAGTIVEGLTVENANNEGIFVQDSSHLIIINNVVQNNGLNVIKGLGEDKAIQLTGTSNPTVSGNNVINNRYGGIATSDDGPLDPSWNSTAVPSAGIPMGQPNPGSNNVISGNTVMSNHPNHCSIVVSAYNPGEGVRNNIVSDNLVVDNTAGIIVAADTPNTVATNNQVISNTILNNGEAGVVIHNNAPGDVVTGNIISGNVLSNDGSGPKISGILVGGEGPVAVQNTTITDNVFQNEYVGIQIVNAKQTLVGGNQMLLNVVMAVNGSVTAIVSTTSTSADGQAVTTTITQTSISTQSSTATVTTTVSGGTTTTPTEGLSFSLALLTAVGTLIVGLVAGMIVRPIREATGR